MDAGKLLYGIVFKYFSLNLDLRVDSEEDRNRLYAVLKNHPDILMAL